MNSASLYGGLFLEGLLSFFTPCVLPLVPLYIGYLTRDARTTDSEGNVTYDRGRTMILTAGFVLGVCAVFFLAGLSAGALHSFFERHQIGFLLAGGFFLVVMGLYALNVIRIPFLEKLTAKQTAPSGRMTFAKAWLMGFLFSFAWSPCIGPMLAQAILTASSSETAASGFLAIACYALGFILIFLLLGLFTSAVLNFLKKYKGIVKYTGILAGLVVLGAGCWMFWQSYTEIHALQLAASRGYEEAPTGDTEIEQHNFTLTNAEGTEISLKDYKGKTVLVNFFGTWCHYCNMELPLLQKLHENEEAAVLLIAAPGVNGEGSMQDVEKYMRDKGYTLEIVYDYDLSVTRKFGISGYPTTFIIKPDGSFLGYVPGYIDETNMEGILADAKK